MKITIVSDVLNGQLKRNRNLVSDAVKSFEGKTVLITIEKQKKKRSNNQNAFYWGVVLPIIQSAIKDQTGEVRGYDDIHYSILLPLFAPENELVNVNTGEILKEKITSSRLTTVQFMEYILEIQKWASDFLQTEIPNPNEQLTI